MGVLTIILAVGFLCLAVIFAWSLWRNEQLGLSAKRRSIAFAALCCASVSTLVFLVYAIAGLANLDVSISRETFALIVYVAMLVSVVGAISSLAGRGVFRCLVGICSAALVILWVFVAGMSWL